MTVEVHILNAGGVFDQYVKPITLALEETYELARQHIPLKPVDVVVFEADYKEGLKDMQGVGGHCPNASRVDLPVDMDHPALQENLEEAFALALLHELHHAARWAAGVPCYDTLADALVSEGSADLFVEQLTGKTQPWSNIAEGKELKKLFKHMQSELRSEQYDYFAWFPNGSSERNIPRWAGYTVGYSIVRGFLEDRGMLASELAGVPSAEIIPKTYSL